MKDGTKRRYFGKLFKEPNFLIMVFKHIKIGLNPIDEPLI